MSEFPEIPGASEWAPNPAAVEAFEAELSVDRREAALREVAAAFGIPVSAQAEEWLSHNEYGLALDEIAGCVNGV